MVYRLLVIVVLHQLVDGVASLNTCTTPQCTFFAESMKRNMNPEVEPCDDFYEFACGNWSANNPLPKDEEKWDIFQIMTKDISQQLTEMFNDDAAISPSTAYQKAKKFYSTCVTSEALERTGTRTILSKLELTGGWPMMMPMHDWNPNGVSLTTILSYYAKEMNLAPFFAIYANPDSQNSSLNQLYIDATFYTPLKDILREYPRNSSLLTQYKQYIMEIVQLFAAETSTLVNVTDLNQDVTDMINFEQKLAKLIPDPLAAVDITRRRNLMTVSELQNWYTANGGTKQSVTIDWLKMLKNILKPAGISVLPQSKVIFTEYNFGQKIIELLNITPIRTIMNYIQWDFVNEMLAAGPTPSENILTKLMQLKTGVTTPSKRSVQCTKLVQLHHAVGHEFLKRHTLQYAKVEAEKIIATIINATGELLNHTSWLQIQELQFVQDKLNTIRQYIGYPKWYDTPGRIDEYYEDCNITDDFWHNFMEVRRFAKAMNLRGLQESVDETEFRWDPTKFNAGYNPFRNAITFTSAVLKMPGFSGHPLVLKYATFGAMAGHEISHAFDAIGARFNRDGNYESWWSTKTKNMFYSKVECFVNQYNNYIIYEDRRLKIHARGDLSKTENIADLHGLKLAYTAYENAKTTADRELRLPGFESYNDEQLFFLAHATLWCSAATRPYYVNKARNNWHSVPRLRAIGSLSNMAEFSSAFGCPRTARMNPPTKCAIWGATDTL